MRAFIIGCLNGVVWSLIGHALGFDLTFILIMAALTILVLMRLRLL